MSYFAGRQEPRAPRKMETQLSEDQWHVLLCRTTRPQRATPRKMETPFSEAQWHARLFRMTEALSETRTFDFQVGFPTFGRRVFVRRPMRTHHFRLGTKGRCYFRLCRMTEALGETPTFDFQVEIYIFGRRVFL